MKSMFHEASTVIKAIEKAWADSGKPLEFTVNVLEVGEKNFLGLTKRPAIVSITYDPRKLTTKAPGAKEAPGRFAKPAPHKGREDKRFETKPKRDVRPEPRTQPIQARPQREMPKEHKEVEHERWSQEMIDDVQVWFKEMVQILNIKVPFTSKADRRMLTLTFDQAVAPSSEDERQLFASLSYLLIQFLKKKHKKKFRGFHLVITSKKHATTDSSKPSSSY